MPKLKTNRAAAKRFRKTAKGFKRTPPGAATTWPQRLQAQAPAALRRQQLVSEATCDRVEQLLPTPNRRLTGA